MLFGDEIVLEVKRPDGLDFVPVENFDSFKRSGSRAIVKKAVFHRDGPRKRVGPRDENFSLSGYYTADDEGQNILREAAETGALVVIRALPDGVTGFEADCYISSDDFEVEPEDFQAISFECEVDGSVRKVENAGG